MYSRLQPLPERYLLDALQSTIAADEFSLDQVNQELAAFARRGRLKRLASFSLGGEFVFPNSLRDSSKPVSIGPLPAAVGLLEKNIL